MQVMFLLLTFLYSDKLENKKGCMVITLQKSHTTSFPCILSVVLEMTKILLNTFPNGQSVGVEGISMILFSINF